VQCYCVPHRCVPDGMLGIFNPLYLMFLGRLVAWMTRSLDDASLGRSVPVRCVLRPAPNPPYLYTIHTKRAIPIGWFWHYTEIGRVSCRVHRLGVGRSERCLDCPWWPAGRQGQPKIRERLMWLSTACIRMPSMNYIFIGLADKKQGEGEGEGSEKSSQGRNT